MTSATKVHESKEMCVTNVTKVLGGAVGQSQSSMERTVPSSSSSYTGIPRLTRFLIARFHFARIFVSPVLFSSFLTIFLAIL